MGPKIEQLLSGMVETLVARWQPERIILFGSHATGRANEHSDIDLLVILPDEAYYHGVSVEMRRELDKFPAAKDIVVARRSTIDERGHLIGTVYREALREGRTLYAAA